MTTPTAELEPRRYAGHTLYYVKVGEQAEAVLRPWAAAQRMKLEEALAAIVRGAAQGIAEKRAGAKPTPPSPAPSPTPAPSPPTGETALAEAPTAAERERRLAIADRDLRKMEQAYGRATDRADSWEAKFKTERELRDDAEERAGHATQAVAELQAKLDAAVEHSERRSEESTEITKGATHVIAELNAKLKAALEQVARLQSFSAPEFVVSERGVQMRIFVPTTIADRRLVSSPEVSIPDTDTPPLPTPSTPEPPTPEPGPDVAPHVAEARDARPDDGEYLRSLDLYWRSPILPRRTAIALVPYLTGPTIGPDNVDRMQRALLARLLRAHEIGIGKADVDRLVSLVPELGALRGPLPLRFSEGNLEYAVLHRAVMQLTGWTHDDLLQEPHLQPGILDPSPEDETPALAEAEAPVPGPVPAAPVPTPRAPLSAPTPVSLPALAPYVNPNPERRPYVRLGPRQAELLALVEAGYTDEEICAHVGCPPASWRGFRKNTLGRPANPPHAVTSAP